LQRPALLAPAKGSTGFIAASRSRKEISFNRSVFLQICTAKTGGREEVCRRVCREDPPGEKNEGHAPQKIERLRGDVNRLRT
jgi:hypothetical protein